MSIVTFNLRIITQRKSSQKFALLLTQIELLISILIQIIHR